MASENVIKFWDTKTGEEAKNTIPQKVSSVLLLRLNLHNLIEVG